MELVPPAWKESPSTLVPSRKMQLQLQLFHNRELVGAGSVTILQRRTAVRIQREEYFDIIGAIQEPDKITHW